MTRAELDGEVQTCFEDFDFEKYNEEDAKKLTMDTGDKHVGKNSFIDWNYGPKEGCPPPVYLSDKYILKP